MLLYNYFFKYIFSGEAILLILTTTAVTTITALSMSAISTNGVIKGGIQIFKIFIYSNQYSIENQ